MTKKTVKGAATENAESLDLELAGKKPHIHSYLDFLRRSSDSSSLQAIEMSIRRDLEDSRKLDKAAAFVGVRLGIALQAGKALVQHGLFENWVDGSFEGFSLRQAQYFLKLGKVFLNEQGNALQLPQAGEVGNYLVKASDSSKLGEAVFAFVGNKSLPELMDHYGIKAKSSNPGGFRPAVYMLARYQSEHKELAKIPFEQWTAEQQAAFREWQNKEVSQSAGNDAQRVASEAMWASIMARLADHGLTRRSYVYLTKIQLEQTRDVLSQVSKELNKALK